MPETPEPGTQPGRGDGLPVLRLVNGPNGRVMPCWRRRRRRSRKCPGERRLLAVGGPELLPATAAGGGYGSGGRRTPMKQANGGPVAWRRWRAGGERRGCRWRNDELWQRPRRETVAGPDARSTVANDTRARRNAGPMPNGKCGQSSECSAPAYANINASRSTAGCPAKRRPRRRQRWRANSDAAANVAASNNWPECAGPPGRSRLPSSSPE